MFPRVFRVSSALFLALTAVSCSSHHDDSAGYTLRIGATSVTGTPAGSLGWGDRQGILSEKLRSAGVGKIEYSLFQSGSDAASALLSGAIDVAAIGDNPALRARSRNPKVVLLSLDSVSSDAWLVGARGGATDIDALLEKTSPPRRAPSETGQHVSSSTRPASPGRSMYATYPPPSPSPVSAPARSTPPYSPARVPPNWKPRDTRSSTAYPGTASAAPARTSH